MLLDTQDLRHHVVDVARFFFSQEFSHRDPSFPRLCISPQSFFFNCSLVRGIIALFAQISDPNSSSFFLVPEFSLAPITWSSFRILLLLLPPSLSGWLLRGAQEVLTGGVGGMDIEGDASEVSSRNACCSPGANAVLITYKRRRTGISATTRMPYFLFPLSWTSLFSVASDASPCVSWKISLNLWYSRSSFF